MRHISGNEFARLTLRDIYPKFSIYLYYSPCQSADSPEFIFCPYTKVYGFLKTKREVKYEKRRE